MCFCKISGCTGYTSEWKYNWPPFTKHLLYVSSAQLNSAGIILAQVGNSSITDEVQRHEHTGAKTRSPAIQPEVLSIILHSLPEDSQVAHWAELDCPKKWGKEEGRSGERISTGRRRRGRGGEILPLLQREMFIKNSGLREKQGVKSKRATRENIRHCSWNGIFLIFTHYFIYCFEPLKSFSILKGKGECAVCCMSIIPQ